MSDNAGVQTGKILLRIALFILGLIPGLIKLIIKGIKAIIKMFKKKENVLDSSGQ